MGGMSPVGFLGFAGAAAAIAGVPPHLGPPAHPAAIAAQAQAQALLKSADLQHRSAAATPEDRKSITITELRRSSSPPEKFRTRTPDLESDPKRRKEEKLAHVSIIYISFIFLIYIHISYVRYNYLIYNIRQQI